MNTKKFFTIFSTLFFYSAIMFSSNAIAQDVSEEYNDAMAEASEVADWDTDDDGMLDAHEFYVVNYRIWDTDNDSRITEEEWQAGMENYIIVDRQSEMAMFTDWDANRDDALDVNEFTLVMVEQDPFNFETSAPGLQMDGQAMQDEQMQEEDQNQADSEMEEPTLVIWQMDNDPIIEKITYGDWSMRFDEDDN